MYNENYIVLRTPQPIVPSLDNLGPRAGGPVATPMEPPGIEIESAELNKSEIHDLRNDPRTKAIAPAMPMTLIQPVEESTADASDSATWGIDAVNAPNSTYDGGGVNVAVLDTGIDPTHPAFNGINIIQKNFTSESDNDTHGHGTHCAGTIFGQDINGTRIGVARNIKNALIGKVLGAGGGSSVDIAKAIQWAVEEGAHVISMSLGIDFPGYVNWLVDVQNLEIEPATSKALEGYRANLNLFTQLASFVQAYGAFSDGTVIVAASGNESDRPTYEIAVAPPAAGTGIISVGALENTAGGLSVASFSNTQVDISAPGVSVLSAIPGGDLGLKSGTSMATPHVAGVAALWAQRQLDMTGRINRDLLTNRLIASGTMAPLSQDADPEDVGSGIVQAP